MLKFAIIGVGGLGKVHLANLLELEQARGDICLAALCDVEQQMIYEKVETNLGGCPDIVDLSKFKFYQDADEMFKNEKLDFIISAVPTYLHESIAVEALEKGIHVFSEKPMALTLKQCQNMINKAEENGRLLMIGHCLRYASEYLKLKEYIDSGEYGKVQRAEFFRYSATPTWTWQNWMLDYEKSGGAALDMHIHDVDFINWVFGMPEAVSSFATHQKTKFDSILTICYYKDKFVSVGCDWSMAKSFAFSPSYLVRFEKAVVKMQGGQVTVYPDNVEAFEPELLPNEMYKAEVNEFIECILKGQKSFKNPPESSKNAVSVVLAEKEAALKGIKVFIKE